MLLFLGRVSLYITGCTGTHSVEQVGFELTEIQLLLSLEFWDERHVPPLTSQLHFLLICTMT